MSFPRISRIMARHPDEPASTARTYLPGTFPPRLRIDQIHGTLSPQEPLYIFNYHLGIASYSLSGSPANVRRKNYIFQLEQRAIWPHRPGLENVEGSPGNDLLLQSLEDSFIVSDK